MSDYRVLPGPEHFLPPAAASMGIRLPNPGEAHINGVITTEDKAYEEAARQFLMAKVPTIFPGPLVLWAWNEKAAKKATAKAQLLAGAMGMKLGRLVSVSENGGYAQPPMPVMAMAKAADAATAIAPGEMQLSATVNATYELTQ